MNERKFHLHGGKTGAALAVRVTTRASRNEITEVQEDGTVKISLTTPPVEGQANEVLIRFLAEVLGIAPGRIEILAGLSGKDKLVSVSDLDSATVEARILKHVEHNSK